MNLFTIPSHASFCLGCLFLLSPCFAEDVMFENVAVERGLTFQHVSPLTPQRHIHLTMGGGVGWVDFDRDGWSDVLFTQGAKWKTKDREEPFRKSDSLFQNRSGRFIEVSGKCGLSNPKYGMGMAFGDVDNDGFPDVYITVFGENLLFMNLGDGTFERDLTNEATRHAGYGASCTWTDLNRDGNIDLFVTNYVVIDRENYRTCDQEFGDNEVRKVACPPWQYPGERDVVIMNQGDGTFHDATQAVGLDKAANSQGLGVVSVDFDRDGDLDVYVANDSVSNQLWSNDGQGNLREVGLLTGTSLNRNGQREAGMGVTVGDINRDGRPELFVTNYFGETNTLYRNESLGFFLDVTDEFGLAAPSRTRLGFGTNLFDADNDMDLDLLVVNGHVHDNLSEVGRDVPYQQRPQLFEFETNRFSDISKTSGHFFSEPIVGRGSATCDFNRDGLVDFAISELNGPAILLENQTKSDNNTISFRLVGTNGNRDGLGAKVTVQAGKTSLSQDRLGSSSYLSCSDEVIHFGVSREDSVDVSVEWLGGDRQNWKNLTVNSLYLLIEGQPSSIVLP